MRGRRTNGMGMLLIAAATISCMDPASRQEEGFAPALGIDLTAMEQRPGGLYVKDDVVGTGAEAMPGQLVLVHYTGWLADGTEFDSSRDSGTPLEVVIGQGNVIQGWDEGVPGMREGGRRTLVIPPQLAYGETGTGGVIPPNATLVFDVELVEVRNIDGTPIDSMGPADTLLPDTAAVRDTAG